MERDPSPYGLIRYDVAPDHLRIKEIVKALRRILSRPSIRFLGNVHYGTDLKLQDAQRFHDAIVFATGDDKDRELSIPGADLDGFHGAAEFVSWYDGHPEAPRDWALDAESVVVLGAGNVALDVARILAKTADELRSTEIPDNVHDGLAQNRAKDVHVFARRGPAQIKITPMELRELAHSPTIDVIVHPEGFELDEGSMDAIRASKSVKLVVDVLQNYLAKDATGALHRIHIHFCQNPVEILGANGRVVGLRTEATQLTGDGTVRGTGKFQEWPVQAVYRAVGYLSDPVSGLPFDNTAGVIPNDGGHVIDLDGDNMPGLYVTGWIKRGPIGLIGHTKSDATQTVEMLLGDAAAQRLSAPEQPDPDEILRYLTERGVTHTDWAG